MEEIKFFVPCLFGLEGILANEARHLGMQNVIGGNGNVTFTGGVDDIALANIFLRTAERIGVVVGEYDARTFDELFEGAKRLNWERWIGREDEFPVTGYSLNSALHSLPDCQSILKKAIVERLSRHYGIRWFKEEKAQHKIRFSLLKDHVILTLDTTGVGLHKRGYRPVANLAPIRETLAAGILDITGYRRAERLCDPMCGSGTFAIEAALYASNTAPGLNREFISEKWDQIPEISFPAARAKARSLISNAPFEIIASDIDPKAVAVAKENARRAGFGGRIRFSVADVADLRLPDDGRRNVIVCNPPYGERLSTPEQVREQTALLGRVFPAQPNARAYMISSNENFERDYGRRAVKTRKLYNGMIKANLYQYFDKSAK